jgi:hypothetical protein
MSIHAVNITIKEEDEPSVHHFPHKAHTNTAVALDRGVSAFFDSPADAVRWALVIVAESLPELAHVDLVASRLSLDHLGGRCTALMAILEQENVHELRAIEADEVRA